MVDIWHAARFGHLAEVQRLVGHDPGLLNARREGRGSTPLMLACHGGRVGVVRWLVDQGVAINEQDDGGVNALEEACRDGGPPVVRLLLERGADPTIADRWGQTPWIVASCNGYVEVVRVLLGHPRVRTAINHRDGEGKTALWCACYWGRGGVARALLESGADPTIADNNGATPMAAIKADPDDRDIPDISAEGRRECVAALEVSSRLLVPQFLAPLIGWLMRRLSGPLNARQEAERAYQLWKARQVADQQGSGAVAVPRGRGGLEVKKTRALLDFTIHGLKGDLFPDLMEYMG
jgi:uncharacterized protein